MTREAALPTGPVLYLGRRDSAGLALVPIGEILVDSLAPFPSAEEAPGYLARYVRDLLPAGSEFVLFAEGVQVGHFTATGIEIDSTWCVPRPSVRGIATWIPEAVQTERVLALPRESGRAVAWGAFERAAPNLEQRQASVALAAQTISELGAEWPVNLLNSRWDLQAFQLADDSPAFAVTYLLRDRLRVERPTSSAASLFLLGVASETGYRSGFGWFRRVSQEGKGAPQMFGHFDWDGDGESEILLEVFGEQSRWVAALDRRVGEWMQVYQDPCGASAPPVAAPA